MKAVCPVIESLPPNGVGSTAKHVRQKEGTENKKKRRKENKRFAGNNEFNGQYIYF